MGEKKKKSGKDFTDECRYGSDYIADEMCRQREDHNITQQEMADMIGVSRSTLNKIENNKTKIPLYVFVRYCEILGLSPEVFLFTGMPKPVSPKTEEVAAEIDKLPDRLKMYVLEIVRVMNKGK